MTMERSSAIMDAIFVSPDEESRGRLLKIIQEFLTSEASKHSAKEKGSWFPIFHVSISRPYLHQRMQKKKQSHPMSIWKNL
jgi:hypothetical protein